MKTKLIAITKPLIDGIESSGELISYCARVSNPSNQLNTATAPKLLRYLVDNAHWSPFEMAHAVIEINTTRDIARQILRHRSFSFQEFSTRYSKIDFGDAYYYRRECRLQDHKNRQNSLITENENIKADWNELQSHVIKESIHAYKRALEMGVAKEQARSLLPEGLTASRLYMSGSIRSWIHYIQIRSGNGTQKEHSEIARECRELIVNEIPELAFVI